MTVRGCAVDGCDRPHSAKSFCGMHYKRWHVHGDPTYIAPPGSGPVGTLDVSPMRYGLTYRQLDYWTRKGYIHATASNPGSGHYRTWPEAEQRIAERMARLIKAGFRVDAAAVAARTFVNDQANEAAPGVYVSIFDRVAS